MSRKTVDLGEIKQRYSKYKYALIYYLSQVHLGVTPKEIHWEDVIEAHFFDQSEELYIYAHENELHGVCLEDEQPYIEEKWPLIEGFGSTLYTRKSLHFDEDGQAFTAFTRLCGWEGA